MLVPAQPATAHGPCSACISPKRGPAGTIVRVNWTAVKLVRNPDRRQDGYGLLQDVYHPEERSEIVFRSERPRKSRFRVPSVVPGKYAVAQYDGSEGGTHYTWATSRFSPRRNAPQRGRSTTPAAAITHCGSGGHGRGRRAGARRLGPPAVATPPKRSTIRSLDPSGRSRHQRRRRDRPLGKLIASRPNAEQARHLRRHLLPTLSPASIGAHRPQRLKMVESTRTSARSRPYWA